MDTPEADRRFWPANCAQRDGCRALICDVVSRSAKLIVEVDSGQHDSNALADEAGIRHFEAQGFQGIASGTIGFRGRPRV
ncbi:DUF559 domain-containing protein [Sphingomonas sp. QA11]|uniref:DUF559 domain-containing protein n=1 Tax=Sphingomonas sp. QA11 TaxID=2950605 RepID=UPI003FA6AA10